MSIYLLISFFFFQIVNMDLWIYGSRQYVIFCWISFHTYDDIDDDNDNDDCYYDGNNYLTTYIDLYYHRINNATKICWNLTEI